MGVKGGPSKVISTVEILRSMVSTVIKNNAGSNFHVGVAGCFRFDMYIRKDVTSAVWLILLCVAWLQRLPIGTKAETQRAKMPSTVHIERTRKRNKQHMVFDVPGPCKQNR